METRSGLAAAAARRTLLALAALALAWLVLSTLRIDLGVLLADVFSVEGAAWTAAAVVAYVGYRLVSSADA